MELWFSQHWRNFRQSIRGRGPFIPIMLAVRQILRPLIYFHAWHIFETDISQRVPQSYGEEGVEVKVYTPEESRINIQDQIPAMGELQPDEVSRRFARGDLIAISFVEEQPVGYMWAALSSGLELAFGTYWIVRPGEAVRYGSFVIPAFRGRGIHSCLNTGVNSYLREHGIVRSLGSVSLLNRQSMSLPKHYKRAIAMSVFVARIQGVNWTIRKSFRAPLESRFSWPKAENSFVHSENQ